MNILACWYIYFPIDQVYENRYGEFNPVLLMDSSRLNKSLHYEWQPGVEQNSGPFSW